MQLSFKSLLIRRWIVGRPDYVSEEFRSTKRCSGEFSAKCCHGITIQLNKLASFISFCFVFFFSVTEYLWCLELRRTCTVLPWKSANPHQTFSLWIWEVTACRPQWTTTWTCPQEKGLWLQHATLPPHDSQKMWSPCDQNSRRLQNRNKNYLPIWLQWDKYQLGRCVDHHRRWWNFPTRGQQDP